MSLKLQTFSAVRWTTLATGGKTILGLIQIGILARLLTPADFGLMALVLAVIAFVQIFADLGVSNAIIHHQTVIQSELSSLFWLNVLMGLGMMLLLMLASPLIATFYKAPAIQLLLTVVSLNFLVVSLGQQLRVLAERDLRFSELAYIDLISALLGLIAATTWAVFWPNVFALVVGLLVSNASGTILAWIILAKGWRPDLAINISGIRKFLGFGGYVMANNVINMVNAQADLFIGGRYLNSAALGMFSLPRELSLRVAGVINPIVTRVGLPVMARVQEDKEVLRKIYLKTLRMTASVNFPVYLSLALFAPEVIAMLLGPQWKDADILLRLLAIWAMLRSTANPIGSLLFAVGRADLAFKWNLALMVIVLPGLWLGAQYGAFGLAVALNLLIALLIWPTWYFLARPLCGATAKEYFAQLLIPSLTTLLAAIFAYLVTLQLSGVWIRLLAGLGSGTLIYILASKWINKSWFDAMAELAFGRQRSI